MQDPLIIYFPSGQTQVAPEGFSKQRKSHDKFKQGLGTDGNKMKKNRDVWEKSWNKFQKHKIQQAEMMNYQYEKEIKAIFTEAIAF